MYGFHKSSDSENLNSFYHPLFLRDSPEFLGKIKRKKIVESDSDIQVHIKDKKFTKQYNDSV